MPLLVRRSSPALRLFAAILLVKALLLAIDHAPMFFLGDSVSYLHTATWGYIPPDRSFLYGWIIRWSSLWLHSLTPLLIVQALAGAVSAFLCAYLLRRFFAAPTAIAAAAGLFCAIEPLQLLFERYVMTETFSLLAFSLFVFAALTYFERPTFRQLLLIQLAAVFVIAMRVSFLPIVESATLLLPLLNGRPWPRLARHLALSCLLFFALQGTYKWSYAQLIQPEFPGARPAYNYDGGFRLLAFVAPIVQPRDFPDQAHAAEVFQLDWDLRDPRLRFRQRWNQGGLVRNIESLYPPLEARRLAKATAWNAVRRDPWGECRLSLFGFTDYFNREHLLLGMIEDRGGARELPDDLLSFLRTYFHLDARDLPHRVTLTNRWYYAAWWWYLALLFLPLPLLLMIAIVPARQRPAAILLFVFASAQIAVIAACSIGPTVRFLHAVAWMAPLTAGVFAARLAALRKKRGPDARAPDPSAIVSSASAPVKAA
jgi:hypothetical protein